MKIGQLRYLIAAAENGSFRRAAEALHVEQSSISRAISQLEDELASRFREPDAARVAVEEQDAEFFLKRPYPRADARLADAERLRRVMEV